MTAIKTYEYDWSMKFIHLTDPHLTASGSLFDIDVDARLRDAVTSINAHHSDATFTMVTGDIAHWGEPGAYARAQEILSTLAMPWYPLIGNHDDRDAYFSGLSNAKSDDTGKACFVVNNDAGTFIALDTLTEGTHAGQIDGAQLQWLDHELSRAPGDVFLFMHHPPMLSGIQALDNIRLQNSNDLLALLSRHPDKVRHLFFGHMHRSFHGSWQGIPFSTVKSTAHQVVADINADKPLVSSRETPAYAVVLISSDTIAIHDISYLEEHTAFAYDRESGRPKD